MAYQVRWLSQLIVLCCAKLLCRIVVLKYQNKEKIFCCFRSRLTFDIQGLYGPKAELWESFSAEKFVHCILQTTHARARINTHYTHTNTHTHTHTNTPYTHTHTHTRARARTHARKTSQKLTYNNTYVGLTTVYHVPIDPNMACKCIIPFVLIGRRQSMPQQRIQAVATTYGGWLPQILS